MEDNNKKNGVMYKEIKNPRKTKVKDSFFNLH